MNLLKPLRTSRKIITESKHVTKVSTFFEEVVHVDPINDALTPNWWKDL